MISGGYGFPARLEPDEDRRLIAHFPDLPVVSQGRRRLVDGVAVERFSPALGLGDAKIAVLASYVPLPSGAREIAVVAAPEMLLQSVG